MHKAKAGMSRHDIIAIWLHGRSDICQCCHRPIMPCECTPFNPDEAVRYTLSAAPGNPLPRAGFLEALAHLHTVSLCPECHGDTLGEYARGWRMQIKAGSVVWVKHGRSADEEARLRSAQSRSM